MALCAGFARVLEYETPELNDRKDSYPLGTPEVAAGWLRIEVPQ